MSLKMYVATREKQRVKRVLLMVEYEGNPHGDVYDLTALSAEMMEKSPYGASIGCSVKSDYQYESGSGKKILKEQVIEFSGDAKEWCSGATHIEDVVNFCMPDGEKVKSLRRRLSKLEKDIDETKSDIHYAKLMQVAAVRSANPIAKFHMDEAPIAIPGPTT